MSKLFKTLCASFCAYSASVLFADAPLEMLVEPSLELPAAELVQMPIEESAYAPLSVPVVAEPKITPKKIEKAPEVSVNPFTGKIKGRKVRLRLRPDLDSRIIK